MHLDLARDDVADRLAAALVGNVHGLHAGAVLEHLEGEMRHGADARRRIVHLVRHRARQRDQLRHAVGLDVVRDHERERRGRHVRDRVVLRHRIERRSGLLEQPLADRERILRHQQRVAVGIGGRDVVPGDVAVGAGTVLHDHRLAECFLEVFGNLPRHRVSRAARHECDHEADRPLRVVLRLRDGERRQHAANQHAASQDRDHDLSSFLSPLPACTEIGLARFRHYWWAEVG